MFIDTIKKEGKRFKNIFKELINKQIWLSTNYFYSSLKDSSLNTLSNIQSSIVEIWKISDEFWLSIRKEAQ